jgi:hypothetical protein
LTYVEKDTGVLTSTEVNEEDCMLDAIIVLVTIIAFVAFIGFTEGCERL